MSSIKYMPVPLLMRHVCRVYYSGMVKDNAVRIGIRLTPEDRTALRKAKTQLKAEHGVLTTSAVIRMAIRKLVQPCQKEQGNG